jgi:hypothetical protein
MAIGPGRRRVGECARCAERGFTIRRAATESAHANCISVSRRSGRRLRTLDHWRRAQVRAIDHGRCGPEWKGGNALLWSPLCGWAFAPLHNANKTRTRRTDTDCCSARSPSVPSSCRTARTLRSPDRYRCGRPGSRSERATKNIAGPSMSSYRLYYLIFV